MVTTARSASAAASAAVAARTEPFREGRCSSAATAAEAAAAGDLVVVTVPLKALPQVPVEPLAGKVVIDTNNYYPERDGQIAELDDETTTTAELAQAHLPTSRVVKGFNHIYSAHLTEKRSPTGTPHRRALAIAGDDESAKQQVAAYIDAIGFDTVDLGPLAEGWRIQRDTPGYGPEHDAEQLRAATQQAARYRDM